MELRNQTQHPSSRLRKFVHFNNIIRTPIILSFLIIQACPEKKGWGVWVGGEAHPLNMKLKNLTLAAVRYRHLISGHVTSFHISKKKLINA